MTMRIGQGFDAHRFMGTDGTEPHMERELWLAGVRWDVEGLAIEGDSDGDVAVHALIDAFLAAAGLGDIGSRTCCATPSSICAPTGIRLNPRPS